MIILFGVQLFTAFGAINDDLAQSVAYHGIEIKKLLDSKRWSVTVKPASILVESKFDVRVVRRVSPSIETQPILEKYRIELRFEKLLPRAAYVKLANQRTEHAVIVNYGAKTKIEWSDAMKFLDDNPLPRYKVSDRGGKSFSVYCATTDSGFISIIPVERYAEVKGAEAMIDHLFWRNIK